MIVPLPVLFILLMILVIFAVYDILQKSQDLHDEANRRVARAVLENTLTRANSGLNGIASRIASQDRPFDKDPPAVIFRDSITDAEDLANRTLFLGFDTQYRVLKGRIGDTNLGTSVLADLISQPELSRLFTKQTAVSRLSDTLLVIINGVPFILSDPQPLRASGRNQRTAFLVIGLPARDMVFDELQKYEFFGSDALNIQLDKQSEISDFAELVVSLRDREYAQFHFTAVAQILILLVAFVLAVMIGRHIDTKNDKLRQSRDLIAKREQEAQHLRQLAERASEAKSQFIHNMSHELRTPLNAVIGFSEIIKDETFGPVGSVKYRDYAIDINESGQHLLGLINDILDLSKIEFGNEELHEDTIEIPEVIRTALKLVEQPAEQDGIKLKLELPDQLPALRADERKLKQILINLLSNAVKFTDAGGEVTLRAWCRRDSGYVFQITDTGIGIAPENIPRALSRFGQVDADLNRRYEGTGLGLPLAKALVELHSGTLDLQSEVGVGTTVTVRFPAERIVELPRDTESIDTTAKKAG